VRSPRRIRIHPAIWHGRPRPQPRPRASGPLPPSVNGPAPRRALIAWALWDCATSPFAAIVVTFVFPAYLARGVVGDEIRGTELWGWTMATSGLLLVVLAPITGAIADAGGPRKPWIVATSALAAAATAALWLATPEPSSALFLLGMVLLANTALELGAVFYNALLPELAPPERMGFWSGRAWAIGYGSGLLALLLVLFAFVLPSVPPFGLDRDAAEHVRIAGPVTAAALVLFTLPLALLVPDRPRATASLAETWRATRARLAATLPLFRARPAILVFFVARLLYNDGLDTLFTFGGLYAAGTFAMDVQEVMLFGILLNLTAGLGAWLLAPLDDRLGSKRTILLSLSGLLGFGLLALLVTSKLAFWVAGAALGLFVGPVQAASRTMLARLAPEDSRAELFGFYALTGRITAALGPWAVGTVTALAQSQRAGMTVILALFLAGFLLVLAVREPGRG
jgi:UMF1 family MFS transporter